MLHILAASRGGGLLQKSVLRLAAVFSESALKNYRRHQPGIHDFVAALLDVQASIPASQPTMRQPATRPASFFTLPRPRTHTIHTAAPGRQRLVRVWWVVADQINNAMRGAGCTLSVRTELRAGGNGRHTSTISDRPRLADFITTTPRAFCCGFLGSATAH